MTKYSTKYSCCYCGREFSRAWNRDRNMKDIHERYLDKGYNASFYEHTKSENINPLSMEFQRNIRENASFYNSYQKKEPTNDTGIKDVRNILGNSGYEHLIGSNSETEPDVDSGDEEKIELPWLIFKIVPKYRMLRGLFKNPNSPQAIVYSGYWWRRCISEKSSKPLDDILRWHMRPKWFR